MKKLSKLRLSNKDLGTAKELGNAFDSLKISDEQKKNLLGGSASGCWCSSHKWHCGLSG